jgi:cell division protein FtsW (lipid II flippase)
MGEYTGDWTSGTLLISSIMSTYLICCACLMAALYLRKKLSLSMFLFLTLLMLVPTTINETKGTMVLLPLGLMVVFLVGSQVGTRLKNFSVAIGTLLIFGALFVPIYDEFIADKRSGQSLSEFLDPERTERYLLKGTDVGETGRSGRGDAFIVPLRSLSNDPVQLIFGLGIGNSSESALGEKFTGFYFERYKPFLLHQFAYLVLELGLMGTSLVFVLFWLVFRDSCVVAQNNKKGKGVLALGWTGVTAILTIGMFYKQFIRFDSISFLFWFYAGLVAAERVRMAKQNAAAFSNRQLIPEVYLPNGATSLKRRLS